MKRLIFGVKRMGPLLRLAGEYAVAHMLTRGLAALGSLLVVRLLSVAEYGWYTVMLAAFTFICTFSDLGATETLSYFRWRSHRRVRSWLPYYHAVMQFRRVVFIFGFCASAAYIVNMGMQIGVDARTLLVSIIMIGIAAWFAVHSSVISYALKLDQHFRQAYVIDVSNEAAKLLAVGFAWTLGLTTSLAGISSVALGALISAGLSLTFWSSRSGQKLGTTRLHLLRKSRSVLKQILPTLPSSMHFALQGPLLALLASHYGSVDNVAETGALGRLGALIAVIAGFSSTVFVPRLIGVADESKFLIRYFMWWVVIGFFGWIMLLIASHYPAYLLSMLGASYLGLGEELYMVTASAVVATWGGFAWSVSRARGWIRYQIYSLPVTIAVQVYMFYTLDFSTTRGVLMFGFATILAGFVYQLLTNFLGLFWQGRCPQPGR